MFARFFFLSFLLLNKVKNRKIIKIKNTMEELKIAARASRIDTAKAAKNNMVNKIAFIIFLEAVIKEYSTNGILKAIEAEVIFLFPATPFKFIETKSGDSNSTKKSL